MASPRPKPTVLKIIEGNPGKRPLNKAEPKPIALKLACPSYLRKDRIACAEWKRISGELYELGLLTSVDRAALEIYCSQYSLYRRALRDIQERGLIATNIRSGEKAHPSVQIAREAAKIIKAIAVEFGLTPSSRARISLPGQKCKDAEFEGLID